jgi:membrane associated rhomboid family serine protease
MGVMAAFGYLFPNTQLLIPFFYIPVKAKWLIIGFIAADVFGGINRVPGDQIAHWAHLGGALTGFIIVLIWNKTNRRTLY